MTLTDEELHSPVWLKLKAHFESELAHLRELNDNHYDPIPTAALRGEIRAIKNSLALGIRDPELEADET